MQVIAICNRAGYDLGRQAKGDHDSVGLPRSAGVLSGPRRNAGETPVLPRARAATRPAATMIKARLSVPLGEARFGSPFAKGGLERKDRG